MSAGYSVLAAWRCPHCDSANKLIGGQSTKELDRFLLEVVHEDGCPDVARADKDEPAAEYLVDGDTVRGIEDV